MPITARARSRLRGAARAQPECGGAGRMARIERALLYPVHVRHHRQAEGRAARRRRLRDGAGCVDEAHLLRRGRADHVHHLGHRLGGRAFVHHLRAADRRDDHDHVRRRADPAGSGHLVEDRAGQPGARHVLRAHRDPGAEEAGPGLSCKIRHVQPQASVPRRRAAGRAHSPVDQGGAGQAGDRSLLADRDGLADSDCVPGVEQTAIKFGSPSFPAYGYDLQLLREADASPAADERRAWSASCRRCRPGA